MMRNGHTTTVGRILPKFVTPSDVRDLKNRVDPFVRALDGAVATCSALPDGTRAGWGEFSKRWRSYFDEEDSWWHCAAQMDQGEAYELDLANWQSLVAQSKCALNAPMITPSTRGNPAESEQTQKTIKTVAIAGAVIAIALTLRATIR